MTVIKIKSSSIAGKSPAANDLATAELALNLADKKLYSKDTTGAIFEIGGGSAGQGPVPPVDGEVGDLWWDGDVLLVWNGSEWEIVGGGGGAGQGPVPPVDGETGDLWWDGDALLVWNGSEWEVVGGVTSVNGETGEVVLTLGDLSDVNLGLGAANGDIITWDGSAWVSSGAPPADISGSSINALNDVDTTGATDGDMLLWETDTWINTPAPTKTSDFVNDGNGVTGEPFITGAEVDGAYLPLTGGNLTGDLTLSTDKITLDATAGSITAAGNIDAGSAASNKYASLKATGRATFLNADNGQYVWINESNGSAAIVVNDSNASTPASAKFSVTKEGSITAAGSGDFGSTVSIASSEANALRIGKAGVGYGGGWKDVGDINLGTDLFGVAENINIALKASDGSAEFAGSITAAGGDFEVASTGQVLIDADNSAAFRIRNKSAPSAGNQITLRNDGSAEFAGSVVAGVFNNAVDTDSGVQIDGERGIVKIQRQTATSTETSSALEVWRGTNNNAKITVDGSASFSGTVTAATFNIDALPALS